MQTEPPSKKLQAAIALVPVLIPLYAMGLRGLAFFRELQGPVRTVWLIFAITQLVAALFTPVPLLSLVLALLRVLWISGFFLAGLHLKKVDWLKPLVIGEGITLLVALVTTYQRHGPEMLGVRLEHPIYYSVSLGVVAFLGLLISTSLKSPLWTRVLLGLFFLGSLLLTGSRGALVAALAGGVVMLLRSFKGRPLRWVELAGLGLGLLAFILPVTRYSNVFQRVDFITGRDDIWRSAWSTFLQHFPGGVGPYQLGPYIEKSLLAHWTSKCTILPPVEPFGPCPAWFEPLWSAGFVAHNLVFHALGETGFIGTVGLLILTAYTAYASWKSQNKLLAGLCAAYLTMSLVDNPTGVPGPHFGEVYYFAMGLAVAAMQQRFQQEQAAAPK